jgi:hypothetical protein
MQEFKKLACVGSVIFTSDKGLGSQGGSRRMFRYFENSAMLSQGVLLALNAGGEINEIDRACRKAATKDGLPDTSSWFHAWTELGDLLVNQTEADLAKRRKISAAHKIRRACVYYGLCERYVPHADERKAQTFARMQACFRRYIELSGEPVQFVEVPYEGGKSLPALFIPAAAAGRAPTVVFIDGFDLYKELVYLRQNGDAARLRNMAMLIVDTPGVGEALRLRGMATRYDTEVPLGFCLAYLASRSDVDIERVGLIGLSLGGYYAPRANGSRPVWPLERNGTSAGVGAPNTTAPAVPNPICRHPIPNCSGSRASKPARPHSQSSTNSALKALRRKSKRRSSWCIPPRITLSRWKTPNDWPRQLPRANSS